MHININRQELCEAVANLSRAVSQKATIPVLEGIYLDAKDGCLKMTAYNLELGMTKNLEATVYTEGRIVLNARIFGEMLRKLSGSIVSISDNENMVCRIESNNTVFEISGMNPNDFPELPEVDSATGVSVPSDLLKDVVRQTVFAVATSENVKPVFTGLLFDINNNELKVVGVDGYRLAVRKEKLNYDGSISFIAAAKAVNEAVKIVKDEEKEITLNVGKRHFSITVNGYTIISRIMDGEFINYQRIMSPSYSSVMTVSARDIVSIIERISLVINDQLNTPVRCYLHKGEAIFSCVTAVGKAFDSCDCSLEGKELEIGFNSKYLTEALKATETEKVKLCFNGAVSPMLILPVEGDSFMYMVMPMRLKGE